MLLLVLLLFDTPPAPAQQLLRDSRKGILIDCRGGSSGSAAVCDYGVVLIAFVSMQVAIADVATVAMTAVGVFVGATSRAAFAGAFFPGRGCGCRVGCHERG